MNEHLTLYCPVCKLECEAEVRRETESYCVKGDDIEIESNIAYCLKCGGQIWVDDLDDSNLRAAFEVYRIKHGLLTPSEIKEIRESYDLSQSAFAKVFGFGEKTITRYENGSLPDLAQSRFIAMAKNPRYFQDLLEMSKDALSETDYYKARTAVANLLRNTVAIKSAYSYTTTYNCSYVNAGCDSIPCYPLLGGDKIA